eukprot:4320105-Amphidinium_carterae.1
MVQIRLIPVKKRFIREYKTKDGRDVEVRLICRLQPKVHWVPEIYVKFGKDYGKGFLEKEAHVDICEVCKQYTFDELVHGSEENVDKALLKCLPLHLHNAYLVSRLVSCTPTW